MRPFQKRQAFVEGEDQTVARAPGARARLMRLGASRQRSILGLPEIVGLAVAGLLLFAALVSYFYLLLPQNSRLGRLGEEREKLQKELREQGEVVKSGEDTQTSVERIVQSLNEFESRHLVAREEAATAIIEELNGLIRRNNLRISTGITFTQFEEADPNATQQQRQQQRAAQTAGTVRAIQNVFPGVGVNLTVEGTYANLRRFVKDVESDRRFVVVNAIELEGSSETGPRGAPVVAPPVAGEEGELPQPSAPAGRAALVSLRLNMGAYFRRSAAQQEAPAADAGAPR